MKGAGRKETDGHLQKQHILRDTFKRREKEMKEAEELTIQQKVEMAGNYPGAPEGYAYDLAQMGSVFGSLISLSDMFPEFKDQMTQMNMDITTLISFVPAGEKHARTYGIDEHDTSMLFPPQNNGLLSKMMDDFEEMTGKMLQAYPDENSIQHKLAKTYQNHVRICKRADYADLRDSDNSYFQALTASIVDFPLPYVYVNKNTKIVNAEYYNKFMKNHAFIDQLIEEQEFFMNDYMPYYEKKKAGTLTDKEKETFTESYIRHLKKRRDLMEEIKSYKLEELSQLGIHPFINGETGQTALEMDWQGVRYGGQVCNICEMELKLLENGWPIEDMELFRSIMRMKDNVAAKLKQIDVKTNENEIKRANDAITAANAKLRELQNAADPDQAAINKQLEEIQKQNSRIEKNRNAIEEKKAKRAEIKRVAEEFKTCFDKLAGTQIHNSETRKKALEEFKPFVATYEKYAQNILPRENRPLMQGEKKTPQGQLLKQMLDNAIAADHKVSLAGNGNLEADTYHMLLDKMKEYKKTLDKGHRIGWHSDTTEMETLKECVGQLIEAVESNKDVLHQGKKIKNLVERVQRASKFYVQEKARKAEKTEDQMTFGTRMGERRFNAAKNMAVTSAQLLELISQRQEEAIGREERMLHERIVAFQKDKELQEQRTKEINELKQEKEKIVSKYENEEFAKSGDKALRKLEEGGFKPEDGPELIQRCAANALAAAIYKKNGMPQKGGKEESLQVYAQKLYDDKDFKDALDKDPAKIAESIKSLTEDGKISLVVKIEEQKKHVMQAKAEDIQKENKQEKKQDKKEPERSEAKPVEGQAVKEEINKGKPKVSKHL